MCPTAHIHALSSHVTPTSCTQNALYLSLSVCSTQPWASTGCLTPAQITANWKLLFFLFFFSRNKQAHRQRLQHSSSLTVPSTLVPQGTEAAKCQEVEVSARVIVPTEDTCQQAVWADMTVWVRACAHARTHTDTHTLKSS